MVYTAITERFIATEWCFYSAHHTVSWGSNCQACGFVTDKRNFFNPLTPKSVRLLISPYNTTLEYNVTVMRMKGRITNLRSS